MSDVRVFIADHEGRERRHLTETVRAAAGMELAGDAPADEGALIEIISTEPDVVVVRIATTEEAIDLCRRMLDARPGVRCLVLAAEDEEDAFIQAVLAGAAAVVREEQLAAAVREEADALPEQAETLMRRYGHRPVRQLLDDLSPQQREVALLVVSGATNSEIAAELGLSVHTVRNYISQVIGRLRMRNRTELAAGLATAIVRDHLKTGRGERP